MVTYLDVFGEGGKRDIIIGRYKCRTNIIKSRGKQYFTYMQEALFKVAFLTKRKKKNKAILLYCISAEYFIKINM